MLFVKVGCSDWQRHSDGKNRLDGLNPPESWASNCRAISVVRLLLVSWIYEQLHGIGFLKNADSLLTDRNRKWFDDRGMIKLLSHKFESCKHFLILLLEFLLSFPLFGVNFECDITELWTFSSFELWKIGDLELRAFDFLHASVIHSVFVYNKYYNLLYPIIY